MKLPFYYLTKKIRSFVGCNYKMPYFLLPRSLPVRTQQWDAFQTHKNSDPLHLFDTVKKKKKPNLTNPETHGFATRCIATPY